MELTEWAGRNAGKVILFGIFMLCILMLLWLFHGGLKVVMVRV